MQSFAICTLDGRVTAAARLDAWSVRRCSPGACVRCLRTRQRREIWPLVRLSDEAQDLQCRAVSAGMPRRRASASAYASCRCGRSRASRARCVGEIAGRKNIAHVRPGRRKAQHDFVIVRLAAGSRSTCRCVPLAGAVEIEARDAAQVTGALGIRTRQGVQKWVQNASMSRPGRGDACRTTRLLLAIQAEERYLVQGTCCIRCSNRDSGRRLPGSARWSLTMLSKPSRSCSLT